jgi:cytochrome c556
MQRTHIRLALVGLAGWLVLVPTLGSGRLSAQDEVRRSALMRRKLEESKKVLEGLTREDYALVKEGADSLKRLSEAAEWQPSTIPNVEQYVAYTKDFQRLCDELGQNAKARNLDGATLAYVQLTLNCVSCHKYVRVVTR